MLNIHIPCNIYYGPSSLYRVVKSIIKKTRGSESCQPHRERRISNGEMMKMHFTTHAYTRREEGRRREREKGITDVLLNGR